MKVTVWFILQFWENCRRSVFNHGLCQDFWFSLIISRLCQGFRKDIPRNTLTFQLASEDQILEKKWFWLIALNLKDIACNSDCRETLERIYVQYVLSKGAFMSKTIATFVQKLAFIWLQDGFIIQLFRTQM